MAFSGNMSQVPDAVGPQTDMVLREPWSGHHQDQMAAQATHINIAPGGSIASGHQNGLRRWSRTSVWPFVVPWARDINMAPGSCGNLHGLPASILPGTVDHGYQRCFGGGGKANHRGISRMLESKALLI